MRLHFEEFHGFSLRQFASGPEPSCVGYHHQTRRQPAWLHVTASIDQSSPFRSRVSPWVRTKFLHKRLRELPMLQPVGVWPCCRHFAQRLPILPSTVTKKCSRGHVLSPRGQVLSPHIRGNYARNQLTSDA